MVSGTAVMKRYRSLSVINIFVALLICVVAVVSSARFASAITKADIVNQANETLAVQAETLTGLLDKYRLLSAVLANRDDVARLLLSPPSETVSRLAQKITSRAAAASGALDIVMINSRGENISSGFNIVTENIDLNLPMIVTAFEGRLGRGVQVLSERNRAYVFTSGIRLFEGYVGVIAVYVGLEELEENWALSSLPIFASDKNGRIVMSNQTQWRMKNIDEIRSNEGGKSFFATVHEKKQYFDISRKLPLLDWELHVISDVAPLRNAKILWGGLAGFLVLLGAVGSQLLINRVHNVVMRERRDRATSLRLERIVRDRTAELIKLNDNLASEVVERRQAEGQLRKTQNELVQTGKLAALGQMSTALSHEYNQPLSATKSYADNALKYLKRGRMQEASENIARISGLADRMAEISRHLRNFARKPNPSFGSALLRPIIDEALEVLSARLKADGAVINIVMSEKNIYVRAGHVRLQQVIVNLVVNALDAMSDVCDPVVSIEALEKQGKVIINVLDSGCGIDEKNLDTIFDPFFTTKEVGKGLGLGLSISFNIIKDFGGLLSASNNKNGGAKFTIMLDKSEKA